MDAIYDLVDDQGCIFLRRLRLRAMKMGISLADVEASISAWENFGIFVIVHGIVLMKEGLGASEGG